MKAIIFDFDGVIAETERKKFSDVKRIILKEGLHLEDSDYKKFIGTKTEFFLKNKFPNLSESKITALSDERYALKYVDVHKNRLLTGVKDLLFYLKEKNVVIAICSGSKKMFIDKFLKAKKLNSFFDLIVSGDDFKSSKPDPECYLLALKKLNLKATDVIVVEDSPAGIIAGKKAGLQVYAIETYLKKEDLSFADLVFKNNSDLLKYLKSN
jgi:HAD superfamily hydrolase (TIGR01509 family)